MEVSAKLDTGQDQARNRWLGQLAPTVYRQKYSLFGSPTNVLVEGSIWWYSLQFAYSKQQHLQRTAVSGSRPERWKGLHTIRFAPFRGEATVRIFCGTCVCWLLAGAINPLSQFVSSRLDGDKTAISSFRPASWTSDLRIYVRCVVGSVAWVGSTKGCCLHPDLQLACARQYSSV